MLGPLFVFSLLALICIAAIIRPAIGLIGFYFFVLLDPEWNWRWALTPGVTYQKFIFACLLIGFVATGFHYRRQSRISRVGIGSLIAFFAICVLSAQYTVSELHTDFFMEILWKELLTVALGILVLQNPSQVKTLLIAAVVAQSYNSFQINLDYFEKGYCQFALKPWGSTGADNNGYSAITVPLLGVSIALALFERRIWGRILYFGIALLQAHQLMLMESRGAMVGAVVMLCLLIWKMPLRNGNIRDVGIAVVLGSLLAGPSVVKEFSSSFASEEQRDSSAESRLLLWKAGWRITTDYPWIGVGPNAARVLVPNPQYYEGGVEKNTKALHNLFFDVSTGMGIPGFCFYFLFFLAPLLYAWRTYRRDDDETGAIRLAVWAGLVGYLCASMFSSGILFESCYILVVAGYCLSNIDADRERQLENTESAVEHAPFRFAGV